MSVRGPRLVAISAVIVLACIAWAQGRDLVINEVAWAGSCEERTAEWVELYNTSGHAVRLDGWRLASSDGAPDLALAGTVAPHGFLLLARASGLAIAGLVPDLVYSGALHDGGEALRLIAPDGRVVDTADSSAGPWPAGTREPRACSMERIDPLDDDIPANWTTSTGRFGSDATGTDACGCGTPGVQNSATASPPQLAFSIQPQPAHLEEPVHFDATATVSPDGSPITFLWDFGDGTTAQGQTATHTYAKEATYVASLSVHSEKGGWSLQRADVDVIAPVTLNVDFSVRPPSRARRARSLDVLLFSDETHVPAGRLAAWTWDFGDGATAQGQTASHAYGRAGNYVIALEVTDARGERGVQTQSVSIAGRHPVADFTTTPACPNPGDTVTFDASASFDPDGQIVSYVWDFDGDGIVDQTSSEVVATTTYAGDGEVAPALWVTDADPDGARQSLPSIHVLHMNRPPQAAFSASSFSPEEGEIVAFTNHSQDPDGRIVSWVWDFGDGTTAASAAATHRYPKSGTYHVTLVVEDDCGAQGRVTADITVANLPPIAALRANGVPDALEILTLTPVSFDASASHDESPQGRIARYEWDLDGDGIYETSGTTPQASRTYATPGLFEVTVRVTDDAADSRATVSEPIRITVVNRPPDAHFGPISPIDPSDTQPVRFADASTDPDGTIAAWQWDFGDGTTSGDPCPTHTFPRAGTYRVTLVVLDDQGIASTAVLQRVTVRNTPPIAGFTASPPSPAVGAPVQFADRSTDPSPDGQIVHIAWDFGDGTTCPGSTGVCTDLHAPTHTYTASGTYIVTLVVIDDAGALSTLTRTITVGE